MPLKSFIEHKAIISFFQDITQVDNFFNKQAVNIENKSRTIYPTDYDQENIEASKFFEQFKGNILKVFKYVANRIFEFKNGIISIKERRLDDYNLYSTTLDIYPFFAYLILSKSRELDDKQRITYIIKQLEEEYFYDTNLENQIKEISDLHIHLGGTLDFYYRINNILTNPEIFQNQNIYQPKEHTLKDIERKFDSCIFYLASILESSLLRYYLKSDNSYLIDTINLLNNFNLKCIEKNIIYKIYSQIESIRKAQYFKDIYIKNRFEKELLKKAISYFDFNSKNYDSKKGDKLLIIYFVKKLIEDNNIILKKNIFSYFVLRNYIKTIIYQQHRKSGFSYFSSYSKSIVKKNTQDNLKNIIKSVLHPYLNKNIEFRISINKNDSELHQWLKKFYYIIQDLQKSKPEKKFKIKTIFHFIKKEFNENNQVIYEQNAKEYKNQLRVIYSFLTNYGIRFIEKNNNPPIDLAHLFFRGIDAAGNELYTPPEVFAPIYNFLKRSVVSSGYAVDAHDCYDNIKRINIQYTYHVGEEFRDIISGLRATFEAIVFLNLKNEDRLGHAIALGIDPALVIRHRKKITLTKGEFFDNLVFMYYIFSMDKNPPYSMEEIKSLIEQLGSEIYGKVSSFIDRSFNIDDYIAAWLLRRNSPQKVLELKDEFKCLFNRKKSKNNYKTLFESAWEIKECIQKDKNFTKKNIPDPFEKKYLQVALPDFFYSNDDDEIFKRYLSIRNNKKAYILYWAYSTGKGDVAKKRKEFYPSNVIFPIEVYEYLQDFIMERYVAKRDIIIEVLPTSNLLITDIGHYDKHPFIRFYPPKDIIPNKFNLRTKKIKIVVGTDNPGIQSTNLMMEYHIINDVVSKIYGKRTAENYVKDIIKLGNKIFKK